MYLVCQIKKLKRAPVGRKRGVQIGWETRSRGLALRRRYLSLMENFIYCIHQIPRIYYCILHRNYAYPYFYYTFHTNLSITVDAACL
jgi:hypothetical protein